MLVCVDVSLGYSGSVGEVYYTAVWGLFYSQITGHLCHIATPGPVTLTIHPASAANGGMIYILYTATYAIYHLLHKLGGMCNIL